MQYDLLVFIGRFQPFHNGHQAVVQRGLAESRHLLILAGSAARPRNIRNPFTAVERAAMIAACIPPQDAARVTVAPLSDAMYNDPVWLRNVHHAAFECLERLYPGKPVDELKIGLVGHSKDKSSYYLRLFPTWGAVDVPNHGSVNATALRQLYLAQPFAAGEPSTKNLNPVLAQQLPARVGAQLLAFAQTADYAELRAEYEHVQRYRAQFDTLRYPPTFHTADALVIQSGHILLVRRGQRPGKGQLALPGGFIEPNETAQDAAVRELIEETGIAIPEVLLRGAISAKETFDDPARSTRGRTFTTAFRFDLAADAALHALHAGDDAQAAFWLPLARLKSEDMFEDHFFIIQKLVGL